MMDDKIKVLKKRAEILSTPVIEKADTKNSSVQILEFLVSSEKYGVEVPLIKEVVIYKGHTSVPKFENYILGFSNIRGQIFTLIDLEKIFNIEKKSEAAKKKIITINDSSLKIGFIADDVLGFEEVDKKSIQCVFESLKNKKFDYILGVTSAGVSIIDIHKILNDCQCSNGKLDKN